MDENPSGTLLPAILSGLIVGIAFVIALAVMTTPQPVQELEMVEEDNVRQEEIAESERRFDSINNYAIVQEASTKFSAENGSSSSIQIDDSPQTLAKFSNIEDAAAVIQYTITKGLYLGEGDRGVRIIIVVDSNDRPAATYVNCLGEDIADLDSHDVGKPSMKVDCA